MLRNFVRKVGEKVLWAMPIAGTEKSSGKASLISARNGRLSMHQAFSPGGVSKAVTIDSTGGNWQITAGAMSVIRVVIGSAGPAFIRLDPNAAVVADPTIADNITIILPAGYSGLLEISDTTLNYFLSYKATAGISVKAWFSDAG